MVGCLGGLGRRLSKWMMDRGARHFVFLGRSGLDKAAARNLVEDLEASGASCSVVRGDACEMVDVEVMVQSAEYPICGVVQAAMGLHVCYPEDYYLHSAYRESTSDMSLT